MTFPSLIESFTADHRRCDQAWAEVERLVDAGQDAAALAAWAHFRAETEHHFRLEEELLFPAFEAATGMTGGPTQVMRMEHEQVRGLLTQMDGAAQAGDAEGLVELGDTLLMLIQQHNMKEEGMLYPMAAAQLGDAWEALHQRCEGLERA